LAYTATNPSPVNPPGGQWPPQLHVLQIGNSDERVIDLTGHMMFPDLLGWQDGGGWLLIQDIWENTSVAAIDADAPDPLSTFTRLVDYACWMEGGEMAVAGWDSGYGESVPVLGSVQLVDVPGTVLADYGLDVIAGSLACLDGDRVAFAKHPPDGVDEPSTLVIAAPDGTTVELTSDRLSVIQRNGNA
jgi:hypothetical protein